EEPTRWLGLGSTIILDPPEFFFELETKRIARDLHPAFKANVPPGIGSERPYGKQTDEVDATDSDGAIKSGVLKPPDPQKARDAHKSVIKALGRRSSDEEKSSEANTPAADSPLLPSSGPTAPASTATATPSAPAKSPASWTNEF